MRMHQKLLGKPLPEEVVFPRRPKEQVTARPNFHYQKVVLPPNESGEVVLADIPRIRNTIAETDERDTLAQRLSGMGRGKSIRVDALEQMLDASYSKDRPLLIDGYQLDKDISTDTVAVYAKDNKAKVIVRGTEGTLKDWLNNIQYAVGNYQKTSRFAEAKDVMDKVKAKYDDIDIAGHSQGGIGARLLGKDAKNIIEVNPAYMGEKHLPNETIIRSSRDPVSFLKGFTKRPNDITIPAKSINPLTEHSYNILKRLPADKIIGKGLKYRLRYVQR